MNAVSFSLTKKERDVMVGESEENMREMGRGYVSVRCMWKRIENFGGYN